MESWQRSLYVTAFGELVALSGFSMVLPFLPYYMQELGITDLPGVTMWSALALSSHAVTLALFAPIWGLLADRHGRKLMVERSMFGGALVMIAMAFVQTAPQLVLLRAIQGCLTGTVAAATTLVASTVPRKRYGYAMGVLQTAVFSGISVGPMLGGVLAGTVGIRSSFLVSGALGAVAGLAVHLFVHEDFKPRAQDDQGAKGVSRSHFKLIFSSRALVSALGLRTSIRTAVRMLNPVLPLIVLSMVPRGSNVAMVTGLIMGINGVGSALGAVVLGRISDQVGSRRVLLICCLGAAGAYFAQFFSDQTWQLFILQAGVGILLGGTVATLSALLANLAPEEAAGSVFGVDASTMASANAVGPLIGAAVAARLGLRSLFLCTGIVLALAGLGTSKLMPGQEEKR